MLTDWHTATEPPTDSDIQPFNVVSYIEITPIRSKLIPWFICSVVLYWTVWHIMANCVKDGWQSKANGKLFGLYITVIVWRRWPLRRRVLCNSGHAHTHYHHHKGAPLPSANQVINSCNFCKKSTVKQQVNLRIFATSSSWRFVGWQAANSWVVSFSSRLHPHRLSMRFNMTIHHQPQCSSQHYTHMYVWWILCTVSIAA